MDAKAKIVIVGWDCAPPRELFERWRDRLPNLNRLMEAGCWGRLRSTDPPITVPAWASMFSSQNPGKLGFYGFRNRKVGTYDAKFIATALNVKVPRLWDILTKAGLRSCILNVPQTFPIKPLNGACVSCFLTPGTDMDYTYPPELKAEIEQVSDGYIIDVDGFRTDDKAWLLQEINKVADKHHKVVMHMLTQHAPWDLFCFVMMGPDRVQHGFWRYYDTEHPKHEPGSPFADAILEHYQRLDDYLGEVIEAAGPDATVLVVSDHGAKTMRGTFNLNQWLIENGYLVLKQPLTGASRFDESMVDWKQTTAWSWGGYYGRIFVNLQGREPQGQVPAGQYETFLDELVTRLCAVPDDKGQPMATRVLKPAELYGDAPALNAPDLFVYADDLYWRIGQDVGQGLYSDETEIGPDDCVHDYDGIFVMAGPTIETNGELSGLNCIDVAPTVLAQLGIPVPSEMEGHVVK